MMRHVMPQDLIDKYQLRRIVAPPEFTDEQKAEMEKIECYNFPLPLHKVNCWFQIYPGTMITNPNKLLFSSTEAVVSIDLQTMYDLDVPGMHQHLKDAIAKEVDRQKRITSYN